MTPMTLTVPAQEKWVLVLRMAAGGVGALLDMPVDVMEDMSVAIDESCDLLLHQDYTAEALTLTCEPRPGGLLVSLEARQGSRRLEEEKTDPEIARSIIQTLVREVALDRDDAGVHGVRMTLPAGE